LKTSNTKYRFKFKREGNSLLIWSLSKREFKIFEFIPNISLDDAYIDFRDRASSSSYKIFIHGDDERKLVFDECMRVIFEAEKIKGF